MYYLITILILTNCVYGQNFNNSILEVPPWPLENCGLPTDCDANSTIHVSQCDNKICNGTKCQLNVAIIATDDDFYIFDLNQIKDIVSKSINDSIENQILHHSLDVKIHTFNDKCSSEYALVSIIEASNICPHVIVGTVCEYSVAQVGRVGKRLGFGGVPVLTPAGMSFNFVDAKQDVDDEYYMLVNGGYADFRSYGEFFILILDAFGWNKIAMFLERTLQTEVAGVNTCKLFMDSVIHEITNGLTVDYIIGDLDITKISYKEFIVTKLGANYGIVIACTSPQNFRKFLIEAYDMHLFEKGEYTIFNFEVYNNDTFPDRPWDNPDDTPENNEKVKTAFRSVFVFRPLIEAIVDPDQANPGSNLLSAVYDSMAMYFNVINQTITVDPDGNINPNQILGCDLYQKMAGHKFKAKDVEFQINCNAQRTSQYALLNLNSENEFKIVATYNTADKTINYWNVSWPFGFIPKDTPKCGYDNSKCPTTDSVNILVIAIISVLCVVIVVMGVVFFRQYYLNKQIYSYAWKVNYNDIIFFPKLARTPSLGSIKTDYDAYSMLGDRQIYATVGYYNTIKVAVKNLAEVKIELNHEHLVELKDMKDLSHDNLVKFYGASVDIPNCILTEYCPRGSLQDILENDQIKLDWSFKMSLVQDIVRGVLYIHSSPIKSHGSLKSSNCLVDGSFKLKITDFGLHFLRQHSVDTQDDIESHAYWQRQLWTAPELLRIPVRSPKGSQKGDVYSFAIILHEIITRQGVFYLEGREMEAREVKVREIPREHQKPTYTHILSTKKSEKPIITEQLGNQDNEVQNNNQLKQSRH